LLRKICIEKWLKEAHATKPDLDTRLSGALDLTSFRVVGGFFFLDTAGQTKKSPGRNLPGLFVFFIVWAGLFPEDK